MRIIIAKIQGSLRDIREPWVTRTLAGEEKSHLSRHKGNDETPGTIVEAIRVSARRVFQAVGDLPHEGDCRLAQPFHRINVPSFGLFRSTIRAIEY